MAKASAPPAVFSDVLGSAATCPTCGDILDIGGAGCRACGEGLEDSSDVLDPELVNSALDELGEWTLIKHEILEKYAHAYTRIVTKQPRIRRVLYFDAFAGSGYGIDRDTGEYLQGSAIRAMSVSPAFDELHFVEANPLKAEILWQAAGADPRVSVYEGDGIATVEHLLERAKYADYHRALCLLDPYDLCVPWSLVEKIGRMGSVEIFYNFMIMDANRNVLWRDPTRVPRKQLPKMDLVWGDRSWVDSRYEQVPTLFGDTSARKVSNEAIAEAFRQRLQRVAGFGYVPKPVAMKNGSNATVYYLFFASPKKTAGHIVEEIFNKYRR